jgi:hypothetical protein
MARTCVTLEHMTTLRPWRFPILIGSGLIAAGILFYFANTHLSTDKTQGAIGKRDVYRDGQVNSADVAQPGTAPVATQAILESSEYKELAKNPAFQQLLQDNIFQKAISDRTFTKALEEGRLNSYLLTHTQFGALSHNAELSRLSTDATFSKLVSTGALQGLLAHGISRE